MSRLSDEFADMMRQAPSRAPLESAVDKLNEKRKYFRPVQKGISEKVKDAEENASGVPEDNTLPLLSTFIKGKKGAALGVEGSFTFKPNLIKGIKALNKEDPEALENHAYKALAMQIKEDLEDKQKTMDLTPAEQLFMNMVANSDIDDVRKEVKALRAKYNIDKKAFDSMISTWRRQHKDRTAEVYPGSNEIGLSVSGGGANASYILRVVEQDGKKYLKGYEAIPRGTDTGDWLKDHVTGGADKFDSIGIGYPADTPEEFNEAFEHWLDAAIGNIKQLTAGRNGKYDRLNKAEDLTYAKNLDGKNAVEVFNARVEDLAKNGALKYPEFQNMLSKWHALGLEIDKNTFDMYLPENVPEGFEPIKFMSKEQKDDERFRRINEQAKSIFEKALAGEKGYSFDEEGRAVRTRETQKKRRPKEKTDEEKAEAEKKRVAKEAEKQRKVEKRQMEAYLGEDKDVESVFSKLGVDPAVFGIRKQK